MINDNFYKVSFRELKCFILIKIYLVVIFSLHDVAFGKKCNLYLIEEFDLR